MTATANERDVGEWDGFLDGWRLDAVVTVLATLLVAGVALDFRSHVRGISFAEEGFFTPEHVFFYAAFLAIAAVIGTRTIARRRAGASWHEAIPPGYGAGVLGVLLFGFGGVGDFLWHSAFGFEENVEALISPSHLALATGAVLFLSSPARATWRRPSIVDGWRTLTAVVSLALALSIVVLFLLFVNPLAQPYATYESAPNGVSIGVAGFLILPTVLLGTVLAMVRRFDLPTGALTLFVLVPGVASVVPTGHVVLLIAVGAMGVVADALASLARPTPANPRVLRLFGALVPLAFAGSYMATLLAGDAVTWTVHVWAGAIVYAGLAGLGLTYVIRPTAAWSAV